MSYKKLLSLLAVSALALGACGTDDAEETPAADETEDTEQVEEQEETEDNSTQDLIEQAKGESGEAFPDYGLTVSGTWTVDGYSIGYAEGEAATIPVTIVTDKESYNVYLLEEGQISEVVSDEAEIEFVVEDPTVDAERYVGITPDDLGEVGDDVSVEDFKRSERIVFEEVEETEEEE